MHYQAHNVDTIREGVEKYGVAAGARVMMSNEYLHADEAVKSGIYMTYYSPAKKTECFRVGSKSKCFCGHLFNEHNKSIGKKVNTSCLSCPCKAFMYVPIRPEECGMWWLPRRKEFDVRTWKAKCKCKHAHDEHAPTRPHRCKMCGNCQDFVGDFACISCDSAWHDHEMLYETEQERKMEKKPTGQAYYPLSQHEDIQEMVFDPTKMNKALPFMRPRPKNDQTTAPKKAIVSQPKNLPIEYPQEDDYEEYKGNSQPVNFGVSGQSYSKPVSSQKAVSGRSGGIGFSGSRMSQQEEPEEENYVQGYTKPLASQKVGSTRTGGTGFGGSRDVQQEPEDYVYVKPSVSQKAVGVKTTGTGLSGTKTGVSSTTKTTVTKSQPSVSKGSTQGVYKKPGERY